MKKEIKKNILELIEADLEAVELEDGWAINVVDFECYPPHLEDTAHYNIEALNLFIFDNEMNDKEKEKIKQFYKQELGKRLEIKFTATKDGCGWIVYSKPIK